MVSKRLALYIDFKEISYYSFENSINCSRGAISKAVKEGKNIGSGLLENILTTYNDLNPEWLLIGSGEMIKNVTPEGEKQSGKWWNQSRSPEAGAAPESIKMVKESVVKYMPLDRFEALLNENLEVEGELPPMLRGKSEAKRQNNRTERLD